MNTSGGLLAKGHPIGATGVAQITECWWQLRGEAGDRQIETRNGYALATQRGRPRLGRRRSSTSSPTGTDRVGDARPHRCASRRDDDGVGRIVLDRPEAKNALTVEMRDGIVDAVRELPRPTPQVARCSSPASATRSARAWTWPRRPSRRRASPASRPARTSEALRAGVQTFIRELWELDKPTVAAVNGVAVGPGAHLALACDFVLVHAATRFIWSFHRWGLVADAGGAYLLPRLVGLPRAKAMVMLGEGATGAEAVDLGLAYRCVDEPTRSPPRRSRSRGGSRPGPTRSLGLSKRLLNASFETDLAHSLELEGHFQSLATAVARPRRGHGRVPREARRPVRPAPDTVERAPDRVQRVAAYNVASTTSSRLLMCRLRAITERARLVDACREAASTSASTPKPARVRELTEETGLVGRIVELLARRLAAAAPTCARRRIRAGLPRVRIIYRTEIVGGSLRHETDESTDRAAWCTREDLSSLPLVELGRLGVELAFPSA